MDTDWHATPPPVFICSHAGSLTNLAKYPASTVQILGAEKALFRWVGGSVGNVHCCVDVCTGGTHIGEIIDLQSSQLATADVGALYNNWVCYLLVSTYRALKTKGNTPKYGLIFHSSFIGRAKQRNKVGSRP
jgi:hypothetical protein